MVSSTDFLSNMDRLSVTEEDILKVILEFLSAHNYHVSMRTLEKESRVTNSGYSDDVLFLRELVLDGDYNEVIDFGNSLASNKNFDHKHFNYIVLRQKFLELIYMKSNVVGDQSSAQNEEMVKTLSQLKPYCPDKEEYTNLCWLVTVSDLNAEEEYKDWTLDKSRLHCIELIIDCLAQCMPLVKKQVETKQVAGSGRLLQLIINGILYESCMELCESVAMGNMFRHGPVVHNDVLKSHSTGEYSTTLLSWLRCLPYDIFHAPFETTEVDICFAKRAQKPLLTHSFDNPKSLYTNGHGNDQLSKSLNIIRQPSVEIIHLNKKENNCNYTNINNNAAPHHAREKNEPLEILQNAAQFSQKAITPQQEVAECKNEIFDNRIAKSQEIPAKKTSSKQTSEEVTKTPPAVHQHEQEPVICQELPTEEAVPETPMEPISLGEEGPVRLELFEAKTPAEVEEEQKRRQGVLKKLKSLEQRRQQMQKALGEEEEKKLPKSSMNETPAKQNNKPAMKLDPSLLEQPSLYETSYAASTPNPKSAKRAMHIDETAIPHEKMQTPHIYNKAVMAHHLMDKVNSSGGLNTSTPKAKKNRNETPPPLMSPVTKEWQDEQFVELEGKENEPLQDGMVYGPVINGVRRPMPASHLPQPKQLDSSYPPPTQEEDAPMREQPPPTAPLKLKGAGPKIKTKDGNAVHLKELIKSREVEKVQSPREEETHNYRDQPYHYDEDEVKEYQPICILEDSQAVRSVAFHPDGELYSVGANSKILRICRIDPSHESMNSSVLPISNVVMKLPKYHRGSIYCMSWSPDGKILATGSNDKSIKLLQFDNRQCQTYGDDIELNIHNGTIRDLAFVPNRAGLLISGGAGDGNVNITDVFTQQVTGILSGHSGNVMTVYAGEGDVVATGGSDNTLRLWDLRSQRCIDVVMVGDSVPATVALDQNDKFMASGQEDGSILLYDLSAGRTLQNFRMHQTDCRSVRFSNDSRYLLTSSYDATISLLHLNSPSNDMTSPQHYVIGKHTDKIIQCRWHPHQDSFLSSSADRTALLWKAV